MKHLKRILIFSGIIFLLIMTAILTTNTPQAKAICEYKSTYAKGNKDVEFYYLGTSPWDTHNIYCKTCDKKIESDKLCYDRDEDFICDICGDFQHWDLPCSDNNKDFICDVCGLKTVKMEITDFDKQGVFVLNNTYAVKDNYTNRGKYKIEYYINDTLKRTYRADGRDNNGTLRHILGLDSFNGDGTYKITIKLKDENGDTIQELTTNRYITPNTGHTCKDKDGDYKCDTCKAATVYYGLLQDNDILKIDYISFLNTQDEKKLKNIEWYIDDNLIQTGTSRECNFSSYLKKGNTELITKYTNNLTQYKIDLENTKRELENINYEIDNGKDKGEDNKGQYAEKVILEKNIRTLESNISTTEAIIKQLENGTYKNQIKIILKDTDGKIISTIDTTF